MIKVDNIKMSVKDGGGLLKSIAKSLRVGINDIVSFDVLRKSVDARDKRNVMFVYSVAATLRNEAGLPPYVPYVYAAPKPRVRSDFPPVVIGTGPAGTFCALILARAGLCPIVIEQGKNVDDRIKDVTTFTTTARLNPYSNIQFGEGGAGTFSDGKLTTGIRDARVRFVLETFVEMGAPKDILFEAKPHVGTDFLRGVSRRLRREITNLGGEYRFMTRFVGFHCIGDRLASVLARDGAGIERAIRTDAAVLAIGHSSRETFATLVDLGVSVLPKHFAVGVRIEHKARDINEAQYGAFADLLPAADYKLTHKAKDGRGVYSFCVCPGGVVVPAASERGCLCVNGMSDFSRDGTNTNGALIVSVGTDDFPKGPLGGIAFQRGIERSAFEAGGDYRAPIQYAEHLLGKPITTDVEPTYKPETTFADLRAVLPPSVVDAIAEAIPVFDRRLRGYERGLLTAVETRTSSPVTIARTSAMNAIGFRGLYPCGEGAGYAGGIMSAAVDGIKCAEVIMTT